MRKPFWKTRNENIPPSFNGDHFSDELRRIFNLLEREKTTFAKAAFLDFAIQVIGKELEAENTAVFLRKGTADSQNGSEWIIPKTTIIGKTERSSLNGYQVISRPWDDEKMLSAVLSEAIHGNRADWNYFNGILYQELKLVVISNGRHHTIVAKYHGDAVADLDVRSLKDSFSFVRTDGISWLIEENGGVKSLPCPEWRLALLYEIAKKRHELGEDIPLSEPNRQADCPKEQLCEFAVACQVLKTKNEEIAFYKKECELLRRQLEK